MKRAKRTTPDAVEVREGPGSADHALAIDELAAVSLSAEAAAATTHPILGRAILEKVTVYEWLHGRILNGAGVPDQMDDGGLFDLTELARRLNPLSKHQLGHGGYWNW